MMRPLYSLAMQSSRSHSECDSRPGGWLLPLCLIVTLCGGCSRKVAKSTQSDADARIRYYSDRIAEHPTLYPVFALLAGAYLDKARQTHDPVYLAQARTMLNRSIEILPNFAAYETMAAVCNFGHRFEDGLHWGKLAEEASSIDTSVTSILVEAYMGLGRYEEARKLLPAEGEKPPDFYIASSLGLWLNSQRRYDRAVEAFVQAADFARAENVNHLVVWSEVSAAGALLDAKRPEPAQGYLNEAAKIDPADINLLLHRGELMELQGQLERAAEVYSELLRRQEDPEVHRRAYLLAGKMGRGAEARQHFEAAEKGFKNVIISGEVFTLGSLARLYCDAEVNLEQAEALAEQNLMFKKDTEAEGTLTCVRSKLEKARVTHPSAATPPKQ